MGRCSQLGLKGGGGERLSLTKCRGTNEKTMKWFSANISLRTSPGPHHSPYFCQVKLTRRFWLPWPCKVILSSLKPPHVCSFVAAAGRTQCSHLSPWQGKSYNPERRGEMLSVCEWPELEWHLQLSPALWRPSWFRWEAPLSNAACLFHLVRSIPPSRLCVCVPHQPRTRLAIWYITVLCAGPEVTSWRQGSIFFLTEHLPHSGHLGEELEVRV